MGYKITVKFTDGESFTYEDLDRDSCTSIMRDYFNLPYTHVKSLEEDFFINSIVFVNNQTTIRSVVALETEESSSKHFLDKK